MNNGFKNKNFLRPSFIFLIMVFSISGCRKLVKSDPPADYVTGANAYSTNLAATAVLNGIYINMNQNNYPFQGSLSLSVLTGLDADELVPYSGINDLRLVSHYKNALDQKYESGALRSGDEVWSPLYTFVFKCTAAIEGLNSSQADNLTPSVKQQLLGEARFLRGLFYFYLVNLYGDVPLPVSTDPEIMTRLSRSSVSEVYNQILSDLKYAEETLSEKYLDVAQLAMTTERVRPTKWAASALLARVYLYRKEWTKAEEEANKIINNTSLFGPLPLLNNVFLKNSKEAIWQLQPSTSNYNTQDAQTFVLSAPAAGPSSFLNPIYLSNSLLTSFEANDLRAKPKNWIDTITVFGVRYYFPYKYKINTSTGVTTAAGMNEYFMMLRLGEQYLIRAEARARQGNIGGAQSDLNMIRLRAGLPNTLANDEPSLVTAILKERRAEFFCELGQRWFDLKRMGKIDEVMNLETPQKSGGTVNWESYKSLYPIPFIDLQRSQYLTQNPGY